MKVFISWSGERSKAVAAALRDWIPDVIQSVEPWMSAKDIGAGDRWNPAINKQLEETGFGIVCLTPDNLIEPWIHFEAGALARHLKEKTYVCPYLVGLEASQVPQGPLSQFQMTAATREGTQKLLETMNTTQGEKALPLDRLSRLFETLWPKFETELAAIPPAKKVAQKRSPDDMIREILDLVRGLDRRIMQSPSPLATALADLEPAERSKAYRGIGRALERFVQSSGPPTPHSLCPVCGKQVGGLLDDFVVRSSDNALVHRSCHSP